MFVVQTFSGDTDTPVLQEIEVYSRLECPSICDIALQVSINCTSCICLELAEFIIMSLCLEAIN